MFKIGQKIVCIKPAENLKQDEIYTVENTVDDGKGINLEELTTPSFAKGYHAWRFKAIDLDLEFAENILSEIIKKVKEEELVHLN